MITLPVLQLSLQNAKIHTLYIMETVSVKVWLTPKFNLLIQFQDLIF